MNRRKFLLNSTYAGLFSFIPFSACFEPQVQSTNNDTNSSVNIPDFALSGLTIMQLQEKMQLGELTAKQIVEMYRARIDEIDRNGIKLNSVIELNPDAINIAEKLDKERAEGKVRGKLHGIPVLLKDNIDTADKMMTTAGSLALEGNFASFDSHIVNLLRGSGAVILGKTNLSEFANWRSERSVSGWSSRGGLTKNPYVLNRNTCGSSSGSGVAVSADLCAVAIGTETDGSVICPSNTNGIVGIKPTVGLLSRSGIIPISHTQDTAGPMARTVTDAAIVLGYLTGVDNKDAKMTGSPYKKAYDYTLHLNKNGLKGKRIGISEDALETPHEKVDKLLQIALEQLKTAGAEIIEFDDKPDNKMYSAEFEILLYEFKDGINKYLKGANAQVKSLEDIIAFNKVNKKKTMPYFQQELLLKSQKKGDLNSKEYLKALDDSKNGSQQYIDILIEKYELDAFCGLTSGPAWCTDLVNGDHYTGYGLGVPYALAGYPAITVPLGFVEELPVGLVFTGKEWTEAGLISIAYAYEQISMNRKAPEFIESIE